MKKATLIRTDDPEKSRFKVTVTGKVDRVVTIKPRSVYLEGNQGDTLETMIEITPSPKYQFSILGLQQKSNSNYDTNSSIYYLTITHLLLKSN